MGRKSKSKKRHCVPVCWPMCERADENHILKALRNSDFSGLFHFIFFGYIVSFMRISKDGNPNQ